MLLETVGSARQSAARLPAQDASFTFHINPTLRVITDSDGAIVYLPKEDDIHLLNMPAAALLLSCDGAQDSDHVINAVSDLYTERSGGEVCGSLLIWLNKAELVGLLVRGRLSEANDSLPTLTSSELGKLAEKLYEDANFPDAYRCARKTVELDPTEASNWYFLGEAAHAAGHYSEARSAYVRYLAENPDDAAVAHLITALGETPPPPRAPSDYISQTFDSYADTFDNNLLNDLDYKAPELLLEYLRKHLPAPESQFRIADLGCGTGLAGKLLHPWARMLVGVDLSSQMAGKAVATGIYDEMHVAEITSWLESSRQVFDLMLAADVFVYFGDLSPVLNAARKTLTESSLLAFTVEIGTKPGYELTVSGRYAHHENYIDATASASGFSVVHRSQRALRTEYGQDVMGHVFILTRRS